MLKKTPFNIPVLTKFSVFFTVFPAFYALLKDISVLVNNFS